MKIDLNSLNEQELRELHREIARRLQFYSSVRRKTQLMAFKVGDRVAFEADSGSVTGAVVRINQKTASIAGDDGRNWRVSPNFLEKIADGLSSTQEKSQTNLFHLPSFKGV